MFKGFNLTLGASASRHQSLVELAERTEASQENEAHTAIVVYDHVGLTEQWLGHLQWLGTKVPTVKWIKSREAGWQLPEVEGM